MGGPDQEKMISGTPTIIIRISPINAIASKYPSLFNAFFIQFTSSKFKLISTTIFRPQIR